MQALLGIPVFLLIAYLLAERRRPFMARVVLGGLLLQVAFGLLVLKVEYVRKVFEFLSRAFVKMLSYSHQGSLFLFGNLVRPEYSSTFGYIFVLQVLPTVIFFAALTAGLYYLGILQRVVQGVAWVMRRSLGTSGPESLCVASNIFLGQTEAPLLIRPFLSQMSRSELLAVMTGGMATMAGGVLAAYVGFLGGNDPVAQQKFALHLMTASIMNAPAALVFTKLLVPETDPKAARRPLRLPPTERAANLIEALAQGAADGLRLAANIAAMLLAFIAVLAFLNDLLFKLGDLFHLNSWIQQTSQGLYAGLSLQWILGWIFRPVAFLMGVSWEESLAVGALLGQKVVLNEFIAYTQLPTLPLSEKARVLSTYALCGFANFSSIAIQLGGIGSLIPQRRGELASLGLRAVLGGSLAAILSAAWVSLLL
jgi:CNT family concentrative nucleoside transporter